MQNIQDLKEKIFFESKNIIDILDKINNVDELLSKQDLVDELANRISFLRLLEKNMEYFITDHSQQYSQSQYVSLNLDEGHESNHEVTEEEAIFNNEFNEIDENEGENYTVSSDDEDEKFNHQLDEIVENEFHENIVSFAEENYGQSSMTEIQEKEVEAEEDVFNSQLNEIEENEPFNTNEKVLSFVDEERILADAQPDNDEDLNEDLFTTETTEEEVIFSNQLNDLDEDEDNVSHETNDLNDHKASDQAKEPTERIPSIFDTEMLEDEILIEENEEQFVASNAMMEQGEMLTETSNINNILSEIKNDFPLEEKEETILAEVYDRRKIVDIDKPVHETEKHASDESFEDLDAYQQEKKIKLANIKGLKAVQTLFDDDPLERETPTKQKPVPEVKEEQGGILKTNIPTNFMEADKVKPEFRLDLNDRIAFSKMLFNGSQSDLNETVSHLNGFRNLEEAKEYLSDLYYERKWSKVDEYAQRLWILVENKFL